MIKDLQFSIVRPVSLSVIFFRNKWYTRWKGPHPFPVEIYWLMNSEIFMVTQVPFRVLWWWLYICIDYCLIHVIDRKIEYLSRSLCISLNKYRIHYNLHCSSKNAESRRQCGPGIPEMVGFLHKNGLSWPELVW